MPNKKVVFLFLSLALIAASTLTLAAGGAMTIDWWTVDGGGGTSTGTDADSGATFRVSGTMGQPDAGEMSGSGYTVHGGFWGGVAAEAPEDGKSVYLPLLNR